ncbi:MAG: DUF3467 domain-containing protein [Planctomycetes bacterium]|nr:DUF3467 domain-containing protein [Planctomycetota bacterium]
MIFGEEDSQHQNRPPQQQQQVRLDASTMETVYANFFALAGSPDEVTIYLGANSPLPNVREPFVKLSHRVMLMPANAKRLMIALQQTVKAHEDRFGPIEIAPPGQPPQTGV